MKKKLVFLLILFTLNSNVLAENYTVIEEDTTHSYSFNNKTLAWDITHHNDETGADDLTSSADPFLFKDGDTFYLLATANRFWKSKDLLTWEEIRGGIVNDPTLVGEKFWAPEVYKYNNRYYLLYTSDDVDGNNWKKQLRLSVTDNLEAGFSKGTIVNLNIPSSESYNPFNPVQWSNVDGSIFFEGNKKYLYFKNAKLKATYVVELDDNFSPIITENSPKYLLSTMQYVDNSTAPNNNSKHPDSPDWEHTRIEGPFVDLA